MKRITKTTLLKQGDKTYQPIEVDGVIYWTDEEATECRFYLHLSVGGNHQIYDLEGDGSLSDFKRGQSIGWCSKIIAQSQPKLDGVPVVSLDSYIDYIKIPTKFCIPNKHYISDDDRVCYKEGYKDGFESNPNQYTQADIEKAIELSRCFKQSNVEGSFSSGGYYTKEQILEQINSISAIEVDEQFKVMSYE